MKKITASDRSIQQVMRLFSDRTVQFLRDDIKLTEAGAMKPKISSVEDSILLDIVVIIKLSGKLRGNFVLSIDESLALKVVQAYLRDMNLDESPEEHFLDGIGEVANVIVANTIKQFPAEYAGVEIGPPHVLRNKGAKLRNTGTELWNCELTTPLGDCSLNLQL